MSSSHASHVFTVFFLANQMKRYQIYDICMLLPNSSANLHVSERKTNAVGTYTTHQPPNPGMKLTKVNMYFKNCIFHEAQ